MTSSIELENWIPKETKLSPIKDSRNRNTSVLDTKYRKAVEANISSFTTRYSLNNINS